MVSIDQPKKARNPQKRNYMFGDYINELKFIRFAPYKPSCAKRGVLLCPCGKEFETILGDVRSGQTVSCGCKRRGIFKKISLKHNMSRQPIYKTWIGIKSRCYCLSHNHYNGYGGRGICLSDEFKDFVVFYDYVSSLDNFSDREQLRLSLDRIDNNGNYERGNLRWATHKVQSNNRRNNKKNRKIV